VVLLQLVFALDLGIAKLADLRALAILKYLGPIHSLKVLKELQNVDRMNKINEGVPHIALRFQIHR